MTAMISVEIGGTQVEIAFTVVAKERRGRELAADLKAGLRSRSASQEC
jgi:hypothetical protein